MSMTLARRHYTVFASMRDIASRNRNHAGELAELRRKEGLRLTAIELDVTDDASVQQAIERIIGDAGKIDVVVNNAGIAFWELLELTSLQQAKHLFETNFFGPLRVNQAVLPHMRQRRSGLLIHISSGAGRLVLPAMGIYCATKFALEAMAETLRYELSQLGIDSLTVEPGPYPTAIFGSGDNAAERDRSVDYGVLAELPRKIRDALATAEGNAQEVADRVVQLIEMPPGSRPVRSLVGGFAEPYQPLNDLALQMQAESMQGLGLGELMALRTQA
jgi:NAD(P)-dependent dehydrogenase (short-subunit alcohol dehydrogenase family)